MDADTHRTTRPTTIAIVGAGRVATALAVLLHRAGHRILVAAGREGSRRQVLEHLPWVEFVWMDDASGACREAETVALGVGDDAIGPVTEALAMGGVFRPAQFVLHLSGSVSLDALAAARGAGAQVLSIHPLQSFPTVERGVERFPGSGAAVTALSEEAFAFGESLARDAGGVPFRLGDEVKPLYHAAAVFCANFTVTAAAVAEGLFERAGLRNPLPLFSPLGRAAMEYAFTQGPRAALTGPAVRGDAGTIARNLQALLDAAPEAIPAYVVLARLAAGMAEESGNISAEDRGRVEEALRGWS